MQEIPVAAGKKKKHAKGWAIAAAALALLLLASAGTLGLLCYEGYIWFKEPSREEYPVRGIDVSEHQGIIEWGRVKQAGYDFTFIKVTEGLDYVDSRFSRNWEEAGKAGLMRAPYHFFTFRSPGLEQARNFFATAPAETGGLPPAVDIELGGNSADVPDRESFRRELDGFLGAVEAHYGRRPILYVNDESYERFIMGAYREYPVWIADVHRPPGLEGGQPWLFWQYDHSGRVDGVPGHVDLDVFNGTVEDFAEFVAGT